jgi:hypothetical protein
MELVLHAASVHVHPGSRGRHDRIRSILDSAGAAYIVNETLEVPRDTLVEGAELPRLAVRRPALDIVFASYDNIVEWNDGGTLASHLHETIAHAKVNDKEIFKENMRLRAQLARLEAARAVAPSVAPTVAPSADDLQKLRSAAAEAIAATDAAEREIDSIRAREAKLRAALRALTQMVPTLMQIAGVLAE